MKTNCKPKLQIQKAAVAPRRRGEIAEIISWGRSLAQSAPEFGLVALAVLTLIFGVMLVASALSGHIFITFTARDALGGNFWRVALR